MALNPADTKMMSGSNSRATGTTTQRNAARYSASPHADTVGESDRGTEYVQHTHTFVYTCIIPLYIHVHVHISSVYNIGRDRGEVLYRCIYLEVGRRREEGGGGGGGENEREQGEGERRG